VTVVPASPEAESGCLEDGPGWSDGWAVTVTPGAGPVPDAPGEPEASDGPPLADSEVELVCEFDEAGDALEGSAVTVTGGGGDSDGVFDPPAGSAVTLVADGDASVELDFPDNGSAVTVVAGGASGVALDDPETPAVTVTGGLADSEAAGALGDDGPEPGPAWRFGRGRNCPKRWRSVRP
jgi:hypothetical protein